MEHASELRGLLVVALEEGAVLGNLSSLYVDPETKRVSALTWRTARVGGDRFYAPMSAVKIVGSDVVIVTTKSAGEKITPDLPAGKSLSELQGVRVTTTEGKHLGTLVDLDFTPPDWNITTLILAEDKELAVDGADIKMADEIIVPSEYAAKVVSTKEEGPGFLQRTFGKEALEETKETIKRVLRSKPKDES